MSFIKKDSFYFLSLSLLFFIFISCSKSTHKEETSKIKKPATASPELSLEETFPHIMKRNLSLYTYLTELKVPPIDVIEMVAATKPLKDLSKLSSGIRFSIVQDQAYNLLAAKFRLSAIEILDIKKVDSKWQSEIVTAEVEIKTISFSGEVSSSLWNSARAADMNPYLITALAEIFGWVVDFNREVRAQDRWRITAERKLVKGTHVGWGSVLAAEYINAGKSHKAVLFRKDNKDIGYYTLEGENLRKMFLKSPLRFGRVTSRFNRRRFHPKLKRIRPHNGVDYGAPIGTPVRSVADGVVTFAGRRGGGGKILKIRHNATYKTAYKHLSRYARGMRKGKQVKQGQIVAYVGNTGLSTGPHLHYEFFINGRFVDPLRQQFPSAKPISKENKASFLTQSHKMIASLPDWKEKNRLLVNPNTPKQQIQKVDAKTYTQSSPKYFFMPSKPES